MYAFLYVLTISVAGYAALMANIIAASKLIEMLDRRGWFPEIDDRSEFVWEITSNPAWLASLWMVLEAVLVWTTLYLLGA